MEGRTMDEARKQRGAEIAAQNKIRHTPNGYLVPSQSGWGKYAVIVEGPKPKCTCPDFELRGEPCKHIFAVQIVIQQSFSFDGETVTETVTVTKTVERKTYPQNWPAYNRAQTTEGDLFPALLRDLCRGITEPSGSAGARGQPWPMPCSARP
jgi:SWIM zinc finger